MTAKLILLAESAQHANCLGTGGPAGAHIDRGIPDHQACIRADAHLSCGQKDRIGERFCPGSTERGDDNLKVGTQARTPEKGQSTELVASAHNCHRVLLAQGPKHGGNTGNAREQSPRSVSAAVEPTDGTDQLVVNRKPIGKSHEKCARGFQPHDQAARGVFRISQPRYEAHPGGHLGDQIVIGIAECAIDVKTERLDSADIDGHRPIVCYCVNPTRGAGGILVSMPSALSHLDCPECGRRYDAGRRQTICPHCNSPLLARYDPVKVRRSLSLGVARSRRRGIWRWEELLPVRQTRNQLTLGEGDTPLVPAARLGAALGMGNIWLKDESGNPTGSFKARGLAVAVSKATELGIRDFVIPTAGNAGGALAAYAARSRAKARVYMPKDAPAGHQSEVGLFGADLVLVDGLISDAGRLAAQDAAERRWFDMSTLKEPYRLEGKKTMGLELADQFDGGLPDVIVFPTGGGTGLVGMWKAFEEMGALGWIGATRPRMVCVQAAGCAPVVRAMEAGSERIVPWANAMTAAAGLRVPSPFADRLILRVLRESRGTAVAVSEDEITAAQAEVATMEGLLAAPEGAAAWAGLRILAARGWVKANERVVLFNTGNGLKYL